MTRTPDQNRQIQSAMADVDQFWYADTQTQELRRKSLTGISKIRNFLWPHKHKVREFYWWISDNWAKEQLIVFKFPMIHDNMPLEGFPMKFQLQGGWTVPHSDLKYLKDGPLANEGLHTILVPANLGWRRVFEGVKQVAPAFSIVGVLVTIAVNIPRLKEVWQALRNAA